MHRLNLLKGQISGSDCSESKPVLCEVRESQRIAIITFNSPKTLNALRASIIDGLNKHLANLEKDPRVSVVILTGTGKAFSAGANIKEINEARFPSFNFEDYFEREWYKILPNFRKPVIAAVSGYCFGGGLEVALMCDMILASQTSKFGLPEIKLGVIPGGGGT
jgi:enoyl-CoA hydratase/carnithine racemase